MLVFVDESYHRIGDEYYLAIGGYGVHEERYRALTAAIYQAKLDYFVSSADVDFTAPDLVREVRRQRIVVSGSVETAEIRGKKLLSPGNIAWQRDHGNAAGYLLARRRIEAAAQQGVVTFGTLSVVPDVASIQSPTGLLPRQYAFLIEQVHNYVTRECPDEPTILVFDTVNDGSDRELNRAVADFLFKSKKGQRFRSIAPTPFCVVSQNTPGSQLADVIAHCMVETILPPADQKGVQELVDSIYALAYRDESGKLLSIYRIW